METQTIEADPKMNATELTAEIVSAYIRHNSLRSSEIPALIHAVSNKLEQIMSGQLAEVPAQAQQPAVPIKKSVTNDHIVCLEDGKKFKSLKRHLRVEHGMTPEQYRAKWELPNSYAMIASDYATRRSELAKSIGLGQRKREPLKKKRSGQSA